ncbi:MAG: biliverdin-producing heme oxygenase [Pirellula sp.]|nr:biliverdin-producing heme oxygenase [Pirellula sp.]
MSVMNMVRAAISESHQQIEQTPFSKGMMDGSITRTDYSRGLVQLWHIHDEIERLIQRIEVVRDYFTPEMIRTPSISRDLNAFGFSANSFPPMKETLEVICHIRNWAIEKPYALLGCIYILEGSRMGSLVIAKPLGKTLGLTPGEIAGIEYHLEGASQTPARMRAFKEKIDQSSLTPNETANLTEGAVRFMELLNDLYAVLVLDDSSGVTGRRKTA